MISVSILDTFPQSRKDIHEQVLFLHGQNLLYLLPFIYFSLMQNKGKDILGSWVHPKRESSTHISPSVPASLSFTPPPSYHPASGEVRRILPRGVGTDKGFHDCLVHRAYMPPTAQLAGGGPHKLQRTQWHRHPFRLALLQAGGLQLRQLYLGRLWPQPGRQVAPYLPGARGTELC